MSQENSGKPVLLQQFEVKGYKNLTGALTFGPLGRINVIHGENNVGKSNLLQAMDLYFRFLDAIRVSGDSAETRLAPGNLSEWGYLINDIFNLVEPVPIEMAGMFSLAAEQRSQLGLGHMESPIEIGIQVYPHSGSRVGIKIVRLTDGVPGDMLRGILRLVSSVHLLQTEKADSRFALLGVSRRLVAGDAESSLHIVPQQLRDALFDAKESRDALTVRRWELFVEAMKQFEPILGPGRFDTAFDRQSNQANLVFDTGKVRIPVDLLGSGVQQIVALLGQLLLTPATLVGIEEPELNLRYTLQKQLLKAFEEITTSEYGPEQLFLSSHSPAFEAEECFFGMELVDGVPVLSRRPRTQARNYTGTRDEEDVYPEMHARRSEPVSYVSSEGLVMLPEEARKALKVEHGGGVSFIPNKETGRIEVWTVDEVERWLTGDDGHDDGAR